MDKTINISISTDEISKTVFKSLILMYVAGAKDIPDDTKEAFKLLFSYNTNEVVDNFNKIAEEFIDKVGMSEHAKVFIEIK